MSQKIIFINGSSRPEKESCSKKMIHYFTKELESDFSSITDVNALKLYHTHSFDTHFKEALTSNVLVIVAPLYFDSFPSSVLDYLYHFESFVKAHPELITHPLKIYGFVNCAFLGGYQNHLALDILEHFSNRLGFNWCGGLGVGSGAMLGMTLSVPREAKMQRPIYKGLDCFVNAIKTQSPIPSQNKQLLVTQDYSFHFFMFSRNLSWLAQSGFKFISIYNKPYQK